MGVEFRRWYLSFLNVKQSEVWDISIAQTNIINSQF